jgi:chromate reductase, NAD(P)H dehydrogenase (quinone)
MRILGISGSLRRDSHNSKLLRAAARLLPPEAELVIWEELAAIPPYNEDDEALPAPPAVASLREAVAAADALLIATPEYNHSLPGQLKNALDWLSRPVATNPARNKPAVVIGASTSMFGAVWAQAEGRKVLAALGARVIDRELPIPFAAEHFDADGNLIERDVVTQLGGILAELVAEVRSAMPAAA